MNRFGSLGNGGDVSFVPTRIEDVSGVRLQAKICEVCGRGFFRAGAERECPSCVKRMAYRSPVPLPTVSEERDWKRLEAHRGTGIDGPVKFIVEECG